MMRVEPRVEYHRKGEYLMSSGQWITVEIKLIKLPNINKSEFPQDYKFSWIAFNKDEPSERILFDNHHAKAPHFRINGQEEYFQWKSLDDTLELFYQKILSKFGRFLYRINNYEY